MESRASGFRAALAARHREAHLKEGVSPPECEDNSARGAGHEPDYVGDVAGAAAAVRRQLVIGVQLHAPAAETARMPVVSSMLYFLQMRFFDIMTEHVVRIEISYIAFHQECNK